MKAQLFITCLGEQFFPNVLKSTVKLLERQGVQVYFPADQTCCGQMYFNTGFTSQARAVAHHWLDLFAHTDGYIVSPSGSCVDMVKHHYPRLFPEGMPEHQMAVDTAARTFELTQFLVNELKLTDVGARFPHKVTYHASCHTLRGIGVRDEPKTLLHGVKDLEFVPLPDEETCCGFGGAFSVIYPEVSKSMMETKVRAIEASRAEAVVALDPGCLMNIAGGLRKHRSKVRAMHLIELLAADLAD